jgi:transcriptional regulator with XRE-family HTH domain
MTDTKLTVLVDSATGSEAVAKTLPSDLRSYHIRVVDRCGSAASKADRLLVFSTASRLDQVAECVSIANKAHRLTALLVHRDVAESWLPYVFHKAGLRALRNMIVHSDTELPSRILNAWAIGAEKDFVADATVINNRLVVRSCSFEEYTIDFGAFPALAAIPEEERSQFELEEDGLLLYWPSSNVHLDLSDIRFANDAKAQQAARIATLGENRAIGSALRKLRESFGLKQADIKGVSERQVRRVESGEPVTVDTVDAYAGAMRIDSDHLLEQVSELLMEAIKSDEGFGDRKAHATVIPNAKGQDSKRAVAYMRHGGPRTRAVREGLQLAADTASSEDPDVWNLVLADVGELHGTIAHDVRVDELRFNIVRFDKALESHRLCIVVRATGVEAPISSPAFKVGDQTSIFLVRDAGIVPSDIKMLELRIANEL